ncbi:hypothetical protein LS482_08200 [Sinomicrobium kalidii]|uniref:hypothetical protein n=1 Tax=Sinomicrobium kalidii TaxID=2900738 RepID=UPI001E2FCF27|nr:hypothetical protein [Sinomicrobium kalidii]UGU17850.1 hypothetical protein LS482_08200 [Sinomicrobium kalidii]
MKKLVILLLLAVTYAVFPQSVDDPFPRSKMRKDLDIFKKIRISANSGLYKYRSEKETDSIYTWAEAQVGKAETYRDFYNIIVKLTDFEGSLHSDTSLPKKYRKSLAGEQTGYFPYPVKFIEDSWILYGGQRNSAGHPDRIDQRQAYGNGYFCIV